MRIFHRLTLGFLIITLFIGIIGFFAVYISQKALQKSIGESSIILAQETLDKIDRNIYHRILSLVHSSAF